jgi:hypothetical protein
MHCTATEELTVARQMRGSEGRKYVTAYVSRRSLFTAVPYPLGADEACQPSRGRPSGTAVPLLLAQHGMKRPRADGHELLLALTTHVSVHKQTYSRRALTALLPHLCSSAPSSLQQSCSAGSGPPPRCI